MELPAEIRFDGWTLHRASGELVKGEVRVRLQSQPLALLEQLLARPGEVVTRDELIARLWPRGVVDFDTALNSAVRRVRTALGDHAGTARYIETIPKRGYRFIGRLEPEARAPTHATPESGVITGRRWSWRQPWFVAVGVALALSVLTVIVMARPTTVDGRADWVNVDRLTAGPESTVRERLVRARHLLQRRANGDIGRALQHLEYAVNAEPDLGPAWASLASAYWLETVEGRLSESVGLPKMRDAAERALRLDPNLVEAHLRLANYWWRTGQRDLGDRHLRRAITLQPDHPLLLSFEASWAAGEGRLEEAIDAQRRALANDPLSAANRHNLAVWLYLAGRIDESRETLLELQEIDPAAVNRGGLLSQLLVLERRFEPALAVARQASEDSERLHSLALAYAGLGRTAQADATLTALIQSPRAPDPIRVAEVYAYRGQRDSAFQWLWVAIDGPVEQRCAQRRCWPLEMAERSPFLAPLRMDPRWESWTESVRQRGTIGSSQRTG